jgi:hypothetical protein
MLGKYSYYSHFFYLFLVVLGCELRVSCFLCWCCSTWAIPPALYALAILWNSVLCFCAQASLDLSLPIYASYIAEMIGSLDYTQLIGWDGGLTIVFLPGLSSNCDPPHLCLPSIGMNNLACPKIYWRLFWQWRAMLQIEPRALCMPRTCSNTELHFQYPPVFLIELNYKVNEQWFLK